MEKELIEFIVKSLVSKPESVTANMVDGQKATILELSVAEEDTGKVIGRHGRIARALRTVLQAASAKSGRHVVLEILD